MIKLSVLNLHSIVLNFLCGGGCPCCWQYVLKYIGVCLNAKISCALVLVYLGSEIDAILSKTRKTLMFIFLKVSVFYYVKKTIDIPSVP